MKSQEKKELCAACLGHEISQKNNEAREQALCDYCFDELSIDPYTDIIGYRKGE